MNTIQIIYVLIHHFFLKEHHIKSIHFFSCFDYPGMLIQFKISFTCKGSTCVFFSENMEIMRYASQKGIQLSINTNGKFSTVQHFNDIGSMGILLDADCVQSINILNSVKVNIH